METEEATDIDQESPSETQPQTQTGVEKTEEETAKTHPARANPFPMPPRSTVRGGNVPPEKFCLYWKKLKPEFQPRVCVYAYRTFPVLDFMLLLTEEERIQVQRKERQKPASYIAKYIEPFESDDWKSELLRRHGSGDYKLYLNDIGVRGNKALPPRTLCKCIVSLRDDDFPPVIEDLRAVDPSDPMNASFLEKMRLTGKLNEPRSEEEQQQMVQAQANAQANASAVETLANAVKDLAKDAREPRQGPTITDPNATAATESVKVMASAAMEGQKIVSNAFDTAQKMQVAQSDPLSKIGPVIELVKTLIPATPPNTGNSDMIMMLKTVLDIQQQSHNAIMQEMRSRIESTERTSKEALDRLAAQTSSGPSVNTGQSSELKVLDTFLAIKGKLDELVGGPNESGIPGWMPGAVKIGELLINGVTNFMHNLAVMKSGQGQPIPPPELTAELPEGETEEVADSQSSQNAIYARQLHEPMKDALQRKMPGHEFGARVCLQLGNTTAYDFLQAQGKDGLVTLLQSAPEVWGTFLQYGAGRQNEVFLEEFLNRDAVYQTIEALKQQAKPAARNVVGPDGKSRPIRTGPVVNATAEPA